MRSLSIFLLVLFVLRAVSAGAGKWVPIHIKNSGFEKLDSNHRPKGFHEHVTTGTRAILHVDSKYAHSGKKSLYIHNDGPQTALWTNNKPIRCHGSLMYRVDVWVFVKITKGEAGLSIRYRGIDGKWSSPPIKLCLADSSSTGWQKLSGNIEPNEDNRSFSIFMFNSGGWKDEVWFDDLHVTAAISAINNEKYFKAINLIKFVQNRCHTALARKLAVGKKELDRLTYQMSELKQLLERLESTSQIDLNMIQEVANKQQTFFKNYRPISRNIQLLSNLQEWEQRFNNYDPDFFAGWQNSMTRVWHSELASPLNIRNSVYIEAVRGETVAVQLIVASVKKQLTNVSIAIDDLTGPGRIAADNIEIHPVGYVKINKLSPMIWYPVEQSYLGWWPDILLDNFPFNVKAGETQPVWISIKVPRDIAAGNYKAKIIIGPENSVPKAVDFVLHVSQIQLSKKWRFRNIMSFHDAWARQLYAKQWSPEMRNKYMDFLLSRRINLTSMYGDTDFSFEEIEKGINAGQNVILLHTIPAHAGLSKPPMEAPWIAKEIMGRVRKNLDEWIPVLQKDGCLKKALFYGFDEVGPEWFEAASHVFKQIKTKYPGLATISTMRDKSYGLDTGLTGIIDNFIPLMPHFNIMQAKKAHQKKTRVWWYDTSWNIEQPLSRSRLIPWMTFKTKADGFLIWCINRWVGGPERGVPKSKWLYNREPVANKIFSDWNPWLDGVSPNSSANYIYPGINGPLSSMRLENFRDGIEDYELLCDAYCRLEQLIKKQGNPNSIALLEQALNLKGNFIQNAVQADWRPQTIMNYRRRLVHALEATSKK